MEPNFLLITNYSARQLKEYKKLLAREMGLNNHKTPYSMHVRSYRIKSGKRYVIHIKDGNRKVRVLLLPLALMTLPDIDSYRDLNRQSEKMFKEESNYGLKDKSGLERIVGNMNQDVFGHILYPTVFDKASYLWYALATRQYFFNGNKRTALLAGISTLILNFYELTGVNEDDLYNISLQLAQGKMSQKQLKKYLLNHAVLSIDLMNVYLERVREARKTNKQTNLLTNE